MSAAFFGQFTRDFDADENTGIEWNGLEYIKSLHTEISFTEISIGSDTASAVPDYG